jgi:NadR type nicotinamide-nucleotide adenylyltransferase
MTLGVTIGKFYPFHLGHSYLITEAKKQVDHLVVLVCHHSQQTITGNIRSQWIKYLHPDVEVIEVIDDLPESPEPWAKRTLEILKPNKPDIAFTSENYGQPWAELMGCQHQIIDLQRVKFPISGTLLRSNLNKYWQMLTPPAKAYFAKRVCVLGVESSGTTTLAQALAQYYQTIWVPEYGRYYWEGRRSIPDQQKWDTYEFLEIAKGQIQLENALAMKANRIIISDTDAFATYIWHRRYVGLDSREVEEIADSHSYSLYFLTEPDFGFIQDGTRESENLRATMHQWFIDILKQKNKSYYIIRGSHESRMYNAVKLIDSVLINFDNFNR